MQVNSRKLPSENLDLHTRFVIPHPVEPPMSNMYSMHSPKVPSKVPMERMYSIDSTLKGESNDMSPVSSPKKSESMFQSMFNAFNVVWEHFARVPGSFIANVNNPLSVTVVQNEGIISHDFFKSLTTRKEPLPTDNVYIHTMQKKESLGIIEKVYAFDQKTPDTTNILEDSLNQKFEIPENTEVKQINSESNVHELVIKRNAGDDTRLEKLRVTVSGEEPLFYNCQRSMTNDRIVQRCSSEDFGRKEMPELRNFNSVEGLDDAVLYNNTNCNFFNYHDDLEIIEKAEVKSAVPTRPTLVTNLFTNMWQKVVGGVTDRLQFRTDTMEAEVPAKPSASPKQRRKLKTVARGRGRGRAKPQLRRSGVSQTRHRKERTKHDLEVDMNDDFESYQESEEVGTLRRNTSVDSSIYEDEGIDVPDCAILSKTHKPAGFTIGDIKPRNCKPKIRKTISQGICKFHTSVRYIPDHTVDCNTYRPRLVSESSIDSEDSYCIIFDTETDLDRQADSGLPEDNYESDESTEDEDDDTDDEPMSSTPNVKFNLKPTVHIMVQWDYAYRAARRGPWEQMARDRDRFRGRINCTERILNPILSTQHRSHIWQERFASKE